MVAMLPALLWAQEKTISGILKNQQEELVPFANVYIEGTTIGTTTNMDGEFTLRIPEGEKGAIVFQYIGYEKKKVNQSLWNTQNRPIIVLNKEQVTLNAVTVTASGKDPAYGIIKKAQKARKKYLNQVKEYKGKVYMKGGAYMVEIPESLPFLPDSSLPDSTDLGLLGLTESVAKFYFSAPNDYKEEMIASKISGFSEGYSWNRANQVIYNFYENLISIPGLSDRGFLSPIAATAMATYDYRLMGVFKENGHVVNKIKVTPKRQADLAFEGHIYIVEDKWNIYALDVFVSKPTPLKFADTVKLKQSYVNLKEDIWMARSLEMEVYFKFLGFGVNYHAAGVFSEYDLSPEFGKKFFSNEVLVVEDTVKKIDSTFWEKSRQIDLSAEETKVYHVADSIEKVRQSPEYLDSLDKSTNKPNLGKVLLTGYTYRNRAKKRQYELLPLIAIVQFNTVEGLVVHPKVIFRQRGKTHFFRGNYTFGLRYAHANQTFSPQFDFYREVNPKKLSGMGFQFGQNMNQINSVDPISGINNTYYTLQFEKNLAKFYQSRYGQVRYVREILNGWMAGVSVGYEERYSQQNRSDYVWKDIEHRELSPNLSINNSNLVRLRIASKIQFKQKYETYPDRKVVLGSKWPALYAIYTQGIGISTGAPNYKKLDVALNDKYSLGNFGRLHLTAHAGRFLAASNLTLVDLEHFNGNQVFLTSDIPSTRYLIGSELENQMKFHTLPFYQFSTDKSFAELHAEHHFNGFIFNKIPLVRRTKFQALAGVNALLTSGNKEYTEFYIGIENILSIMRIDLATSYQQGEPLNPVLRLSATANF